MTLKKRIKSAVSVLCALLCTVTLVVSPDVQAKTSAQLKSEIGSLNTRMETVRKEQADLQQKAQGAAAEASTLLVEINGMKAQIDNLDEQIILLDQLIVQYDALIIEEEKQIEELDADIAEQERMIADMLRMSYENDSIGSILEFLFSAESFSDMISRVDMIAYHLTYNTTLLDRYKQTLEDRVLIKAEYEESLTQLSAFKTEQEQLRGELAVKQAAYEEKYAQAQADAEFYESAEQAKQNEISQIDAEIAALSKTLKQQEDAEEAERKRAAEQAKTNNQTSGGKTNTYTPNNEQSSGGYIQPLPRGVWRLTSYYGYRSDPFTGKTAYHTGYDMACSSGTPIYAVKSGTVTTARYAHSSYGNYVVVSHGGGIMSLYAHCSALNVTQGQYVNQGDVIAYVGSTGRSTGPHLHFSMYKDGALTDPNYYVKIK